MVVIKDVVPTFFVQDTCRSTAWYQRVLGGNVAFESGGYCGVDLGSARIHLAQVEAPPPRGTSYKGAFYLRLESGVGELWRESRPRGRRSPRLSRTMTTACARRRCAIPTATTSTSASRRSGALVRRLTRSADGSPAPCGRSARRAERRW